MTDEVNAWEEALIADIREHDGRPTSGPLKRPSAHAHVLEGREVR